jgi:predicted secreted protein
MIALRAACCLLLLAATPAIAGDTAQRQILGFSPDGRTFAFEEYGVQDGSGFPYSNIYVIDTATDGWVDGAPVRVRIDGDMPPLHEARAEAMDQARPVLERHRLFAGDIPGNLLASNPVTELSADPHRVEVLPAAIFPPIDAPFRLVLDEFPLPATHCFEGGTGLGFRLVLEREGRRTTLHEDGARVPASRNCPTGYRLADVILHRPAGGGEVLAVLVSFTRDGFEGPDVRWLAVTAPLP